MNVKTQSASPRYSRRVPMRILVEIRDGLVYSLAATKSCEVVVVDRDVQKLLSKGDSAYASVWRPRSDRRKVDRAFRMADP